MHHNVKDHTKRSTAVTTVTTGHGEAVKIRKWCEEQAGLTLGIGLGFGTPGSEEYNRRFRIGHMGHLNVQMVMGTLGSIEAALVALGIPHGAGAIAAASQTIAGHGKV